MGWAQQKRRAFFFYWWTVFRLYERYAGSHLSEYKKLPIASQALYLAAHRAGCGSQIGGGMALVRRMIELGGDPAVGQWLPLRMAAQAGDLPAVEWLIGLSRPSDYAVSDAIAWASEKERSAVIERLERFATEGR